MGSFLRENWIWILTPIVLLVIALLVVAFRFSTDDDSMFIYNIF